MRATANSALWESNFYQQEDVDTSWIKLQTQLKSSVSSLPFVYDNDIDELIMIDNSSNTFIMDSTGSAILDQPRPVLSSSIDKAPLGLGDLVSTSPTFKQGTGLYVSPDETRFYLSDTTTDRIDEYIMSTPGDLTTATATGEFISLSNPYGIWFSPDGLHFYANMSSDRVYQYDLSTAWDLSTSSYVTNVSYSGTTTLAYGLSFSSDGKYMYLGDAVSDYIRQFILSTPWSISTATYNTVLTHGTEFTGTAYGTQMIDDVYMLLTDGSHVYSYDITVPKVISNHSPDRARTHCPTSSTCYASFVNKNKSHIYFADYSAQTVIKYELRSYKENYQTLDTSGKTTSTFDIRFKPDGTKLYIFAFSVDTVYEYDLSTAWDITSATDTGNSLTTDAQGEASPSGFVFKPDGTEMYTIGTGIDRVQQYTLSTAWDISTATYTGQTSTTVGNGSAYAVAFKTDGLKCYTIDSSEQVREHTLSVAWDITTLTYDSVVTTYSVDTTTYDLQFSDDGLFMYILCLNEDALAEYYLDTAWDTTTGSNDYSFIPLGDNTSINVYGAAFNADKSKLYIADNTSDSIKEMIRKPTYAVDYRYSVSNTAEIISVYDVPPTFSVSVANSNTAATTSVTTVPVVSANSTHTVLDYDNDTDVLFSVSDSIQSAWDVATLSYNQGIASEKINPYELQFKPDGSSVFTITASDDGLKEFTLTTPWDISTMDTSEVTSNLNVSQTGIVEFTPRNFYIGNNGGNVYLYGDSIDNVIQLTLSESWKPASVIDANNRLQVTPISSVTLSDDGKKLFTLNTSDVVTPYDLTVAWNVATATSNAQTYSVNSEDSSSTSIRFANNGVDLYMTGTASDQIHHYNMTESWNVATASLVDSSSSYGAQEGGVESIAIKPDGTKLYTTGTFDDFIYEYDLGETGSITAIDVASQQTTLTVSFVTPPLHVRLPDNSNEWDFKLFELDDANAYITAYSNAEPISNTDVRNLKFKLIGNEDVEVTEARINLWKAD